MKVSQTPKPFNPVTITLISDKEILLMEKTLRTAEKLSCNVNVQNFSTELRVLLINADIEG